MVMLLIPCSARTISSFCQTIIFFGSISIHCGGRHPVSVMVNTLLLKYISCCSTSSLRNMPPATTHLKILKPGQPYRLSACHLSMQHNHGLTRTVLCTTTCVFQEQSVHHHRPWKTTPTMYRYCAKEDDGLTEGAYCSCTAGYEIYACFFLIL
jgi:hypothetical protein